MSPRFRIGARSDVGMQRHNNQDSLYAGPRLIAVADGVGGAAGGEVASSLTITALRHLDVDGISDPNDALNGAADNADTAIRQTVARDASLSGMSTTLTAILATDEGLTLAHIGDSRAYLFRGGVMSQLTRDHTLVQSLIDEGQITEDEALSHPRRSWILRALDGRGNPELDLSPVEIEPGDRLLVCSDGLSSYVDEAEIIAELGGQDPQLCAERLINLALRAGGPDNVSVVVADPSDDDGLASQSPILGGAVAEPPPSTTAAAAADAPDVTADDAPEPVAKQRNHSLGKRLAAVAAVIVILIAAGVAGIAVYIHSRYYVAASGTNVAVFRGQPGKVAGHSLGHLQSLTDLPVTAMPQPDQDLVKEKIKGLSKSSAATTVEQFRRDSCTQSPTPIGATTPTPQPTPHQHHLRKAQHPPTPVPTPTWCVDAS